MRLKRQKANSRTVEFYRTNFGFREPFRILCDGTFIHHLVMNRITPADTALRKILSGSVKLFTTRCVITELKMLGSEAADVANILLLARCNHERRKSAEVCLTEVVGENNLGHFFVATQDADLRKKLQKIPGVPLIYALRSALLLEKQSPFQRQFAEAAEQQRSHMTELEHKMLNMKRTRTSDGESRDFSDANEGTDKEQNPIETQIKRKNKKATEYAKDKVQFKRKRAKGPNPLSCKKKKTQGSQNAASEKGSNDGDKTAAKCKRKRSRKSKNAIETNS